jgi:hypothetical protein
MRSTRILVVAVLAVVLALSSTQNVFAAALDQKQEVVDGSWNLGYGDPSTLGQEFQPSLPILVAVEVNLVVEFTPATIILNVRHGTITGAILGSASLSVPVGTSWVYFSLGSVSVTPSSTYVIEVTDANMGQTPPQPVSSYWSASDSDSYPKGAAIVLRAPTGFDFAFRTYGESPASPPTPVGASVGGLMEPVNKLAVFVPYLALFGVIGAVAVVFWKRPNN